MKSFKELCNEVFDNQKDVLDQYGNKKLISTVHSKERTEEREANNNMVKDVFKKVVDHMKKTGAKQQYGSGDYLHVTSKSLGRTFIFNHRADKYATNDKRLHLIHTNTLPLGKHASANPRDIKIKVEDIQEPDYIYIEVE